MPSPRLKGAGSLTPRNAVVLALVFTLALAATLLVAWFSHRTIEDAAQRAFQERIARAEAAILDRLRGYESVVRGAAGLFAASHEVSRSEWRTYVASLRLNDVFPGVRGMHFAVRVTGANRAAHVAAVRAEGFGDYDIRPPGTREQYYPVLWPEPFDARNRRVMGFDMYSEPVRREAMQRARDSGLPTISGRVVLAGETTAQVPGFLMYFPVYRRGASLDNAAERQRAIVGFVLCPFRMPDLIQGVSGEAPVDLRMEIYDGARPSRENWLHGNPDDLRALAAARPDVHRALERVEVGGRVWTIFFEATPQFVAGVGRNTPHAVLLAGALITLALGVFTARLLMAETRAQEASLRDSLTGLFNRRYLDETLRREEERARRSGEPIGIIQFDLDRFKQLNDTLGHDAGDAVLKAVADLLLSQTRGEDVACRYGGEELTVLLPGANLADAQARAEQLRKDIEAMQVMHRGATLPAITVSAGVAAFPLHGADAIGVLHRADQALLRAKNEGRNRVIVA